jgi:diamine N-acetyltransferase
MSILSSIRSIHPDESAILLKVLHKSFKSISEEYSFTRMTAPKHGSFITLEELKQLIAGGLEMYGCFENDELIGCIGIRPGDSSDSFYIEKLGVLPDKRHRGIGRSLVKCAMNEIKKRGGRTISIGLINKNEKLKNWYHNLGFIEYELKDAANLPFKVCMMSIEI